MSETFAPGQAVVWNDSLLWSDGYMHGIVRGQSETSHAVGVAWEDGTTSLESTYDISPVSCVSPAIREALEALTGTSR